MTTVLVANPKGGVGKTTLSTHVAGHWANAGQPVLLGDLDRQGSSALWLSLRPAHAAPIQRWNGTWPAPRQTHLVLDTPAGLRGKSLREAAAHAQKILVPLAPSIFDFYATSDFLTELVECLGRRRSIVAVVGMRVDSRTIAAERLQEFVTSLSLPWITNLRDTQTYVQLAAQGLCLFDLPEARHPQDREQWAPITRWLAARS